MIVDMRRVQIHLPAELDDAAGAEAARRGISKAALVREALGAMLGSREPATEDPWEGFIGILDGEPVDDIDEYLYGWNGR